MERLSREQPTVLSICNGEKQALDKQLLWLHPILVFSNDEDVLIPIKRALVVAIVGVNGLNTPNICSQDGIVSIGTIRNL